uniref:Uncharacterized protein n=1 Tax=Anguilla anguilla TaxID=7936 RepID=A0A0E9XGC4_ANGAN
MKTYSQFSVTAYWEIRKHC